MIAQDTRHLFPLSKIGSQYHGYFMRKDGEIFSTKRSSTPQQIFGSGNRVGVPSSYTLNGASYPRRFLISAAKSHPDFLKDTGSTSEAAVTEPKTFTSADRHHAASVEEGVKQKGWMIGTVVKNKISFSEHPAIHLTEISIKNELQRLATLNPGTRFVSVKITHSVIAQSVVWE